LFAYLSKEPFYITGKKPGFVRFFNIALWSTLLCQGAPHEKAKVLFDILQLEAGFKNHIAAND
jgi:hypothetical protein